MSETTTCPNLFDDPDRASRPQLQTPAPLPMTPEEIQERGWEQVDVVFITGDAYVDSPSFANGLLARVLEADGFKVAVLSQPNWNSVMDFRKFGRPRLAFCVSAGNMDSMLNHYTANRKVRNDDAYTPGGKIGRRPDRATLSYCQRAREAFPPTPEQPGVPVLCGGIEASLRRIAHYDYWSDRVRRSILLDAKADLLMYGMGERTILEVMRRLNKGESIRDIRDVRGTVYRLGKNEDLLEESDTVAHLPSFEEVTGTDLLAQQSLEISRLQREHEDIKRTLAEDRVTHELEADFRTSLYRQTEGIEKKIEKIRAENVRLAKMNFVKMTQIAYENLNPYCAKTLLQECGDEAVVINPPAYPLAEEEMNAVYALPFTRKAHPSYTEPIPAVDVVASTVQTHRGCFGGCTFCAITAHQGKFIQNRSEDAILDEIKKLVESVGGSCTISDMNAPTANMYRLGGKNTEVCHKCTKISCLCPQICKNLDTDQSAYVELLRRAREIKRVKQVLVASGIRTDLAVLSVPFIGELAAYHTGGHLKTAPEHVDNDVLKLMNKPPIENHEEFCELFQQESLKAGKEQYTIPYLISGFPGSTIKSMVEVAEYLKAHDIRPEQVQDFIPAPFQLATCAYYTGVDPVTEEEVHVAKTLHERRLQHALIFYYNPAFYDDVKAALKEAGREDLIGTGPDALIPPYLPKTYTMHRSSRVKFLKRQTAKDKEAKERRRAEFAEKNASETKSFGKRVSRNHDDSGNGGYRSGARAFGKGGSFEGGSFRDRNGQDGAARKPFKVFDGKKRDFHAAEESRDAAKFDENRQSFRRRSESEGEEFRRSGDGFQKREGFQKRDGFQKREGFQKRDGFQKREGFQKKDGFRDRSSDKRRDSAEGGEGSYTPRENRGEGFKGKGGFNKGGAKGGFHSGGKGGFKGGSRFGGNGGSKGPGRRGPGGFGQKSDD